ncbi:MAG: SDR family NAD(P)-dependent oxidoreductase [Candidatus Binatia bacterium]
MRGLAGKTAVVTGGGQGIGAATAQRLSREGVSLVIVDIDGDRARETVKALDGPAIAVAADVSTEDGVRGYRKAGIDRFGRLDLYHLNAGIGGAWGIGLADIDMADFDRVTAVNQRGIFLGLREALRTFRNQGTPGAIVTTASTAGIIGGGTSSRPTSAPSTRSSTSR